MRLLLLAWLFCLSACGDPSDGPADVAPPPKPRFEAPGQTPVAESPASVLQKDGVLALQRALIERGYLRTRSGSYDLATETAVRAFQRDAELPPTGQPDLETLRHLGMNPAQLYGSDAPPPSEPPP